MASRAMRSRRSASFSVDRRGLLAVGAQQMLALRDERVFSVVVRPPCTSNQGSTPLLAADQPGQVRARLVVADHRDEGRQRRPAR